MKFKSLIISCVLVVLCIFSVYSEIKYYNLKQDYIELKYNDFHKIDSLNTSINDKLQRINILEQNINILNSKIDSLENIKKEIHKSSYTISGSTSESIQLLKKNLEWRD